MSGIHLHPFVWIAIFSACCLFLASMILIAISGLSDRIQKADLIVVLGTRVHSEGDPSPRLRARLEKAFRLFEDGYAPVIAVSGGIDRNGSDEAAVMRTYLVGKGLPGERVICDNQGIDTYRTARNISAMMRENGWMSVMIVSQYFHIARAGYAFKAFGIAPVFSAHADYFHLRDIYSLAREVMALLVYRLRSAGSAVQPRHGKPPRSGPDRRRS